MQLEKIKPNYIYFADFDVPILFLVFMLEITINTIVSYSFAIDMR